MISSARNAKKFILKVYLALKTLKIIKKIMLMGYAINVQKMIKKKNKKLEKIGIIILFSMGFLTLLLAFYGLFSYAIKNYPLERAIKHWDKINDSQEFLMVNLIDENRGIAFVNYNCKSGKILKGVKKCKGEYYIFINKINDEWIVNESSKTIIW